MQNSPRLVSFLDPFFLIIFWSLFFILLFIYLQRATSQQRGVLSAFYCRRKWKMSTFRTCPWMRPLTKSDFFNVMASFTVERILSVRNVVWRKKKIKEAEIIFWKQMKRYVLDGSLEGDRRMSREYSCFDFEVKHEAVDLLQWFIGTALHKLLIDGAGMCKSKILKLERRKKGKHRSKWDITESVKQKTKILVWSIAVERWVVPLFYDWCIFFSTYSVVSHEWGIC